MSRSSDKWGAPPAKPGRQTYANPERVLTFLREYARRTRFGATPREILTGVGLTDPTAMHREMLEGVLERLLEGGMAVRDGRGPRMYRADGADELYDPEAVRL